MKNKTTKILLIIVLAPAVVTVGLAWMAFNKVNTPNTPATEITKAIETTEETQATETTIFPATIPEPTETEAPTTEPLWVPQKLTQADFADKLTDLTDEELEAYRQLQYSDYDIADFTRGDVGENYPQYANLDLDLDGKQDRIYCVDSGDTDWPITFELNMGNGIVTPLEIKTYGGGTSAGFSFTDINGSGKDDILSVLVIHSTVGNQLDFALFADVGGRYCKQSLPHCKFYLEDLDNGYVRLSCSASPYKEVFPLDGSGYIPYLEADETLLGHYFGNDPSVGKTDYCRIVNLKTDGGKLIVMYNFLAKSMGAVSSNPFGAVWNPNSGGWFTLERFGTDILTEYWPEALQK